MRVLEAPTTVTLIEAIEVTTMIEKLHAWATGEIERERAAGTDPADPRVRQLLERVDALIEAFTGGDARIRASPERTCREEGPEKQIRPHRVGLGRGTSAGLPAERRLQALPRSNRTVLQRHRGDDALPSHGHAMRRSARRDL